MNLSSQNFAVPVVPVATVEQLRERIRRKSQLKGRQADETAVEEVRSLIGERPAGGHRRDLLIEHLHRLNDAYRCLHERHLVALAKETNLPMAEVYEVATFYHHFEVVRGDGNEDERGGASGHGKGDASGGAISHGKGGACGDGKAPGLTVRVCDGLACAMAGAKDLLARLPALLVSADSDSADTGSASVRVIAAPCLGRCEQAPAVVVHQYPVAFATAQAVLGAVQAGLTQAPQAQKTLYFEPASFAEKSIPRLTDQTGLTNSMDLTGWAGQTDLTGLVDQAGHTAHTDLMGQTGFEASAPGYTDYATYRAHGGYALAASLARGGEDDAERILQAMENSGLRGLGGAGFPAGRKWRIVREQTAPRLMAVNIDEGEPGTFKDRTYLERDPHRFLEGLLIAAQVVGIDACYIYLRDEYHGCRALLQVEIAKLQANPPYPAGVALPLIELRRGAGAYICGEESAMLESIEGRRGEPRMRPPYIAQVGLFGRPTLAHNFETLYWVRDIVQKGPQWFSSFGRHGRKGLRSFSVSGRVKFPGVKLAPAGITVQELIDEYCGGMAEGHRLYAYLPGGASGGILAASLSHIPLDFDTLQPYGCFIGSAAVIVLSQQDRARDAALNVMRFLADESCGQCTPCRVGTAKAARLMAAPVWDGPLLEDLAQVMGDASICGLGQAAPNPIRCIQKYFPHEVGEAPWPGALPRPGTPVVSEKLAGEQP